MQNSRHEQSKDWWDNFEQLFDLYDEEMHGFFFEDMAGAIAKTSPIQYDEGGSEIRPPGAIPYRRINDTDYLKQCHQSGCAAAAKIRTLLHARELSHELFELWGDFNFRYGVLSAAANPKSDDLGPLRSAKGGGRRANIAAHTWVAKQLARRILGGMQRPDAAIDLAKSILRCQERREAVPDGYDPAWDVLTSGRQLKSTYEPRNFPDRVLADYAGVPLRDLLQGRESKN